MPTNNSTMSQAENIHTPLSDRMNLLNSMPHQAKYPPWHALSTTAPTCNLPHYIEISRVQMHIAWPCNVMILCIAPQQAKCECCTGNTPSPHELQTPQCHERSFTSKHPQAHMPWYRPCVANMLFSIAIPLNISIFPTCLHKPCTLLGWSASAIAHQINVNQNWQHLYMDLHSLERSTGHPATWPNLWLTML